MSPKPPRFLSPETPRIAALVLCVVCLWCWVQHRWDAEAWRTPVEYTADCGAGDVIAHFAGIKSAAEGYFLPFFFKTQPRLGAPFSANWNDYPSIEEIPVFLAGILADTTGLFPAANIAQLLVHLLAALAFYAVCRSLKCSWPWAFSGALAFGFAQFGFAQGQHHWTVALYWHIPLCLLVCHWASGPGGLRWSGRRLHFALAVAVVTGLQNVYYTSLFIQLLGLTCLLQAARGKWKAGAGALITGTVAFVIFLSMNVDTFLFGFLHGVNRGSVIRHYCEMELTALKFTDCFMPAWHRFGAFARLARWYYSEVLFPGEIPPSSYFGLAGIAGLGWAALALLRRFAARPARPLPAGAFMALWIFFFATIGGINALAGIGGMILFRSTTRYSIVLLCLVLLFLFRRVSLLTARLRPVLNLSLAALVAGVALWDQLPPVKTDADLRSTAALVRSDRLFAVAMEKRLPEGAMVFQLPVVDYPESPVAGVPAYDHFRPYLYTDKLRFSFGSGKGRLQADWQRALRDAPVPETVAALERYGFAALYVNRRHYADNGEQMIRELRTAGCGEILDSPNHDLFCVVLHPSPVPAEPTSDPAILRKLGLQ